MAPHGQGRPRPWPPAGGGSAPRPLRSCGAEVGSGRGVGLSQDAKGARGASPRAANSSALETSLRLVPKGFWGMMVYGGGRRWGARGGNGEPQRPRGAAGARSARKGAARGLGPWPRRWLEGPRSARPLQRRRPLGAEAILPRPTACPASLRYLTLGDRPTRDVSACVFLPLLVGGRAGREGWGKRCAHVGRRRAGALEKGEKSISLDWIALHFPGKMGTIARRINLEKDFGYGTRNENAAI